MTIFEAEITHRVSDFLNKTLNKITQFETANHIMSNACGILHYFDNQEEYESLKNILSKAQNVVKEPDRAEYGDFQTNIDLAINITKFLKINSANPKIILEPTCGKGNFIVASLSIFKRIEKVFAVEIYKPYVWEAKFNILQYFIDNPSARKPKITISHFNVFDFNFTEISKNIQEKRY
jgi:tRNA/tmRNA/rRNA uracil-C5-methylase (TrmA/RlmC/RlmD family)